MKIAWMLRTRSRIYDDNDDDDVNADGDFDGYDYAEVMKHWP